MIILNNLEKHNGIFFISGKNDEQLKNNYTSILKALYCVHWEERIIWCEPQKGIYLLRWVRPVADRSSWHTLHTRKNFRPNSRLPELYPASLHTVWLNQDRETLLFSFSKGRRPASSNENCVIWIPNLHKMDLIENWADPFAINCGFPFDLVEDNLSCYYLNLSLLGHSSFYSNKCFFYNIIESKITAGLQYLN